MPSVVVEERAATSRAAFDLASDAAERAVRRTLDKSGLRRPRQRGAAAENAAVTRQASDPALARAATQGSHIGRRVGRSGANLARAADRPEKRRRDFPVDTAQPKRSATDRKVGAGATATRNSKLNTRGMQFTLEDSMQDRPSRKSTRRSENRSKTDSQLRRRQMRRVRSPGARARRASAKPAKRA